MSKYRYRCTVIMDKQGYPMLKGELGVSHCPTGVDSGGWVRHL